MLASDKAKPEIVSLNSLWSTTQDIYSFGVPRENSADSSSVQWAKYSLPARALAKHMVFEYTIALWSSCHRDFNLL